MFLLDLLLIIILVIIDQITKYIAIDYLKPIGSTNVIPDLLNFTYVQNKGAAFGLMSDARWIFIIGTILIIIVLLYMLSKGEFKCFLGKTAAILIIAGGIGNPIDRISLGYVIDFIDVSPLFNFAVFNFADCCVTVGAILLIISILFFYDVKEKPAKESVVETQSDEVDALEETEEPEVESEEPEEEAETQSEEDGEE